MRRLMRKSSSAGSWVIRLADHFFSRRQVSIRSMTHAGVASGLWCGVEGRSCRPSSPWRRHRLTHFDAHARPGNGPLSTLRNSRDASGHALLFIQAETGAVVRGVKASEFDYPT